MHGLNRCPVSSQHAECNSHRQRVPMTGLSRFPVSSKLLLTTSSCTSRLRVRSFAINPEKQLQGALGTPTTPSNSDFYDKWLRQRGVVTADGLVLDGRTLRASKVSFRDLLCLPFYTVPSAHTNMHCNNKLCSCVEKNRLYTCCPIPQILVKSSWP